MQYSAIVKGFVKFNATQCNHETQTEARYRLYTNACGLCIQSRAKGDTPLKPRTWREHRHQSW
ncbi:hypothetical protein [Photorhabdus temperata]|uniref:hypothetical protein n=1 Tax=Photorhabdus temperata TaxID=574560 RepID=UPI0012DC8BEF|nr:hypothetical protein [Photorhabdus temperata]